MTAVDKAIARELRSVAREIEKEAQSYRRFMLSPSSASGRGGLINIAQGLEAGAGICNRRASKLTAKAKKKERK